MGMDGGDEQMQEPASCGERIFVSVRMRPLSGKEIARHDVSDWECINDNTIIYRNRLSVSERSMYPTAYTFDRVFSSDCSNQQVYEAGAKEVALSVVSGINSSVFAYGQTSSGKTYTMTGITEYAITDIYDYIRRHKEREFILKFSAMEIYNESVRDLLSADSTPLRLLDDPERGTVVEKLTEETLRDWNHFKELLLVCEAQRQIGETSLNEASSRSHQILKVTIESSAREFLGNGKSSTLAATVNFVDLAGSERASQTLSAGARLKEGCHINRSLLTLGTVIRKLSKGRNGHIPFRDSKLTRILQSSLGGNARTAIICTLSPARTHVEQSRNTLLFASCAKEVTTNAQVNVVVSDKALVKQLQRELARLENELRNAQTFVSSDSAELLREKDLEIEKLRKEINTLIQQRELARSEVEELRQSVKDGSPGDEKTVKIWEAPDQYLNLRVQNSWDFEHPNIVTPLMNVGDRSFTPSDRQSFSSEESFLQLPDFKLNMPHPGSSPHLSPKISNFVGSNLSQDENGELVDENSEAPCKEVRCIDSGRSSMNQYSDSILSESSPKNYKNYNMSSPRGNLDISGMMDIGNEDRSKRESVSFHLKNSNNHPDIAFSSPEKPYLWELKEEISSRRSFKLTRSISCKASLMTTLTSEWIERLENDESTPPIENEKDFPGRPDSFRKKLSALKYDLPKEGLSRNGSQNSSTSATEYELNIPIAKIESQSSLISAAEVEHTAPDVPTPEDQNNTVFSASILEGTEEMSKKQLADHAVQVTETIVHVKDVKDVGLDPIPDNCGSPSVWPSEFKRLQREIIELWHACNVSLVHRTYFFLLFKGDPKDYIYMEVEHRRLSFLKCVSSHGNQMVENGHVLNPASSEKDLRRERHMLSQQMRKRLSAQERDNLFLKWGIGLNTKHRRLQLAYGLWTDCKDMDHIAESAAVVAKLVGFVDPEKTFKEMFGLNFTSGQLSNKRNYSLKRIVLSFL